MTERIDQLAGDAFILDEPGALPIPTVTEGSGIRQLLETSGSMVGSLVITSGLGFVYWWVAARAFPESAVGIGAAAVSAMWLFGALGMFGLGTLLTRELPHQPGRELSLILAAVATTAAAGLVFGLLFAVAAPALGPDVGELGSSLVPALVFAAGAGLTASGEVLDLALIGAARPRLQLLRNVVFAVVKLGAVVVAATWFVGSAGLPIYATWTIGLAVSVIGMVGYMVLRARPGVSRRPAWRNLFSFRSSALDHHLLNLTLVAPSWILPIVVTVLIGPVASAAFFVAALFAGLAFFAPEALIHSLFAVSSRHPEALWRKVQFTVGLSLGAAILATMVVALLGPALLGLFGEIYREQGAFVLLVLTAATIPMTIRAHYIAILRIRDANRPATLVSIGVGALELSACVVGALLWGLNGVAIGLAVAVLVEGILMAPMVYRASRRPA